ncbi:hypothetical protein ACT2FY_37590 [Paraburkholderia fungorum]|jgi:hypothetical protein|uniref:Uncharacterized protein n=1 Tax=Paraburkholderia dioscoreae TaxID=2604047 RepID=A0A5Q4ZEA8_9BURK|nr:hypothetical protein [Paraburkholderia dioscoreae]VVD31003.1 conserved protein of unknown function [Paraburkholderia dioscoreae]
MFHTIGYKGHYIHLSYVDRVEKIEAQIVDASGGFVLKSRRTLIGAKRAITRHIQASGTPANCR